MFIRLQCCGLDHNNHCKYITTQLLHLNRSAIIGYLVLLQCLQLPTMVMSLIFFPRNPVNKMNDLTYEVFTIVPLCVYKYNSYGKGKREKIID